MRRETQNILLVLLGGALVKIGVNGDYLRYVKPAQQPWVVVGGAVILALGVIAMVRDIRAAAAPAGTPAAHDVHEHEHGHSARPAWMLMIPVLTVFLIAPPALGADSVSRTQARAPQSANARAAFPPLPAADVLPMSLTDFVTRAGWDRGGTLNGRTVALTGFLAHGERGTVLARMVIGCCAADAYPVTVRLPDAGAGTDAEFASMPADTWVEVTGRVVPGTAVKENEYTPELTVASLRPVIEPADPYEY